MTAPVRILAGLTLIAYPVLVWRGLSHQSPRAIALILLLILVPGAFLRLRASRRAHLRSLAIVPLVTITILGLATLLDSLGFILLVPVAISTTFLIAFGVTLRSGSMPMIERFARLQEESLDEEPLRWCRLWTWIWCGFFLLNGTVAALLGLWAPLAWWTLYNGLLSYVLTGVLFATEWILRRRRFPDLAAR